MITQYPFSLKKNVIYKKLSKIVVIFYYFFRTETFLLKISNKFHFNKKLLLLVLI